MRFFSRSHPREVFQIPNIIDIINILKKEYGVIIMSEHPVVVDDSSIPNIQS